STWQFTISGTATTATDATMTITITTIFVLGSIKERAYETRSYFWFEVCPSRRAIGPNPIPKRVSDREIMRRDHLGTTARAEHGSVYFLRGRIERTACRSTRSYDLFPYENRTADDYGKSI